MAEIITTYQSQMNPKRNMLIVHCEKEKDGIEAISINRLLAEKLIGINPKRRSLKMAKLLNDILDSLPKGSIIKDFDVMFNPEYDIDVLKTIIDTRKQIELIWPGSYEDEKLIYSEKELIDYKVFNLSEYDITCIV